MSKTIKYTVIGLILLLGAGFLVITFTMDSFIRSKIEKIGSEMTGTRVTVDGVSISPFSGEGTITGFRVGNPEGYSTEHAMEMNDFFIRLDVKSLLSDEIIIEEIIITGPSVYVEQKLTGNNLRTILNSINKAAPKEASPDKTSDAELLIKHFLLQDGMVNLHTSIGGERSAWVKMSMIELHDLGRDNKRQAVEQIVAQIADRIIAEALKSGAKSGTEQVKDMIEGVFK